MKQPTKQQQQDEALEAYHAIVKPAQEAYLAITDPAFEAYRYKLAEIDAQPDEVAQIITINGRQYKLIGERNDR